ncbi:hypothetical protein SDC9_161769 [bioreactor metagenome]|uniref:Uncharacterized protein n=1 Tax=bioreactor metagenome TaxID=1076179 RepID=A0A645FLL5_9ZZZZ
MYSILACIKLWYSIDTKVSIESPISFSLVVSAILAASLLAKTIFPSTKITIASGDKSITLL